MSRSTTSCPIHHRMFLWPALLLPIVLCLGCGGPAPLTIDMPLHLEDHVDAATVVGSEVPEDVPSPIEWTFDEPQPDWKALDLVNPPPRIETTEGALRVSLGEAHGSRQGGDFRGRIYVELPDLTRSEWSHVLVRARSSEKIRRLGIGFNLRQPEDIGDWLQQFIGDNAPVVNDSTIQTYRFRADWSWSPENQEWEGPWRELVLGINSRGPASLDILSVALVPKAAVYADSGLGIRTVTRGNQHRRTLYTHVPSRLAYQVRVPDGARLDVALGTLDAPVTFRVTAEVDGQTSESLIEESYADGERWGQRSVDLSHLAGMTVTLALETEAERPGAVAFWGAPTISVATRAEMPNVIFYVIDGGAADYMSVYGYNRRTTPNLERLAAEGAVFEHAYSNSSWSKPSTTSFMTSLQHSVLGNTGGRFDPLPDEAVTMAEHFHDAGYHTAVFTSNAWAGSLSSLDRGVDVMRDKGAKRDFVSSLELHGDYWRWREAYPGQPYWVHFQTTDVHEYETGQPEPVVPFTGLFVTAKTRKSYYEDWKLFRDFWERNPPWPPPRWYGGEFAETGIDRVEFFETMRSLYDESMAHQDYQIGRLVERLKNAGEWENTLLIVAADHSVAAALWDLGALLQDSLPPVWNYPMLRPSTTRVPLIMVWPGHVEGGQRFETPVSMIDVMPTLLDLVGIPPPDAMQGRSLAPALLGLGELEPRPVILDEFWEGRTGTLRGLIEVVDGQWGASLQFGPPEEEETARRPWRLLLYDLWNDPWCLNPVNERYPELVEKYTAFLEAQYEAHQALALHFTPGGEVELTPEQLETLRALGYIQ